MPTLVWKVRANIGTSDAGGNSSRRESAVPDPVVSTFAVVSGPVASLGQGAALPAVPSKQYAEGGKKKKRKTNRAEAATSAIGGFEREFPRGVGKVSSGRFRASIRWGGKGRYIGTFDNPEQASAAFMSVEKNLLGTKISALGADAAFDEARNKAVDIFGGVVAPKRDLPTGVQKIPSGKFQAKIRFGGKFRGIGTFDTPEQASAAFMSVRKDLDEANPSKLGTEEIDDIFEAAKAKALKSVRVSVPAKRELPRGVRKVSTGKFVSQISWGGKERHIGTFDTPDQASAAYVSMRKDLDNANRSAVGADELNAAFDAAKKKAREAAGGVVSKKKKPRSERDISRCVKKTRGGKFEARIYWGGKYRYIGTFDTPEQASAACMSARKDSDNADLSSFCANAAFDAAKVKAVETVGRQHAFETAEDGYI